MLPIRIERRKLPEHRRVLLAPNLARRASGSPTFYKDGLNTAKYNVSRLPNWQYFDGSLVGRPHLVIFRNHEQREEPIATLCFGDIRVYGEKEGQGDYSQLIKSGKPGILINSIQRERRFRTGSLEEKLAALEEAGKKYE
ncbi:Uncharacterised protein [uncultured archaeon]|nr:Uncharacterised protein [uncultured archaeon]